MPSSAARAFIFATNASNEPAEFTPSAIAASLALSTSIAYKRSRTLIRSPALRPTQLASDMYTAGVATTMLVNE